MFLLFVCVFAVDLVIGGLIVRSDGIVRHLMVRCRCHRHGDVVRLVVVGWVVSMGVRVVGLR